MNNTLFNLIILSGIVITLLACILLIILVVRIFLRIVIGRLNKNIIPRYNFISFVISMILAIIFFINLIYNPFFLPKGYLTNTIGSPNGNYEAKVYHYSGFINYKNVRIEVVNNDTQKAKTIYYNYVNGPLHVNWIGKDRIKIEEKLLNVEKDKYDFRYD